MAEHEGVRVVVDHGVLVRQQPAGAGQGDGGAVEAGRRSCGLYGAAGCGAGYAAAVCEVVVQGGDGVGDGAGGLKVDEVVDAVAAAGAVSLGCPVEGRAHVPVLDGQGDQTAGPAGNVPGEAAPETHEVDAPVRVGGDDLAGQAVAGCLAVGPGGEVLDPVPERGHFQGAGPGLAERQVVGMVVE